MVFSKKLYFTVHGKALFMRVSESKQKMQKHQGKKCIYFVYTNNNVTLLYILSLLYSILSNLPLPCFAKLPCNGILVYYCLFSHCHLAFSPCQNFFVLKIKFFSWHPRKYWYYLNQMAKKFFSKKYGVRGWTRYPCFRQ